MLLYFRSQESVCVCVCKRGKVLGVDCKVREANFRCGVEAGDEETVLGGDGGTRFQCYQINKTKMNNTLIIPLSDWTNIYLKCLYQARKASGHVYVC
jgi:hypothetical protein